MYHAFRTPEFGAQSDFEGPFGEEAVEVEEWVEWVLGRVPEQDGVTTILAHPACMCLSDGFGSFRGLCLNINKRDIVMRIRNVSVAQSKWRA